MLSYHADMDINTNPFELRLDRLVDLEIDADFVGTPRCARSRRRALAASRSAL